MDPATIMATASAVQSLPQFVQGIQQKREAEKLKRSEFIPQALRQTKKYHEIMAGATQAPGQEYAEQEIDQSMASAVSQSRKSSRSSSDLLNTVGSVQAQGANQKQKLAANVQELLMDNDKQLTQTLLRLASQQQQNQRDFQSQKQQLLNASSKNLYGAATTAGEGAAAIADYEHQKDLYQNYKDNGGGSNGAKPGKMGNMPQIDRKNNQLTSLIKKAGGRV